MADSTEQLQDIEELDSRVDALLKEIDSAASPPVGSTPADAKPQATAPAGSAAVARPAEPKASPPAAAPASAPDSLLASVSDEIETVAPGPLSPPHPVAAAAQPEPPEATAVEPAIEPAAPVATDEAPAATDARVDALIDAIGQDLDEQATRAESGTPGTHPDSDFLPPDALPPEPARSAPASAPITPRATARTPEPVPPPATPPRRAQRPPGSIDDLDAALADNADQAVDQAVQETAQAAQASAPAPPPREPTSDGFGLKAAPTAPSAPTGAPPAQPTAAPAAPTAPGSVAAAKPVEPAQAAAPAEQAGVEAGPGVGVRVAVALLRPLSPVVRVTERMSESNRQTLAYIAVMTMFFGAVTWAIVMVKKPPSNEPLEGGFPFVKQDDPPVEPRPRPAAEAKPSGGHGDSSHGPAKGAPDTHGAKKKADAHGAPKSAEKPEAKKDSPASAPVKPKKPAGKPPASAEHH